MEECLTMQVAVDGPILKGVRRWAQLEARCNNPDDYEPTAADLERALHEMLVDAVGRHGCRVCGAPGPGDYPRADLSGGSFGMSEERNSYFDLELDCDDGDLGGYLAAWHKFEEEGWGIAACTIVDYCPCCGRKLNHTDIR